MSIIDSSVNYIDLKRREREREGGGRKQNKELITVMSLKELLGVEGSHASSAG